MIFLLFKNLINFSTPAWWPGQVRPLNQLRINIFSVLVQQRATWTGFSPRWPSKSWCTYMLYPPTEVNDFLKQASLWPSSLCSAAFSCPLTTEQTFTEHRLYQAPRSAPGRQKGISPPAFCHFLTLASSNGAYMDFLPQNFWHGSYLRILSFVYTSSFQHLSSELFTSPRSNPHHNSIHFLKSDLKRSLSWFCLNPSPCGEKTRSHKSMSSHLIFSSHTLLPSVLSTKTDNPSLRIYTRHHFNV